MYLYGQGTDPFHHRSLSHSIIVRSLPIVHVCVWQRTAVVFSGVAHVLVEIVRGSIWQKTAVVFSHVVHVEIVRAGGRQPDADVVRGLRAEEQDRSERVEQGLVVLPCHAVPCRPVPSRPVAEKRPKTGENTADLSVQREFSRSRTIDKGFDLYPSPSETVAQAKQTITALRILVPD